MAYLKGALGNSENRLKHYLSSSSGERFPERDDLQEITSLMDDFLAGKRTLRWTVLPGLRGVGKTTLLAQSYHYLMAAGVPRERILYLSVDDLRNSVGASLSEALSAYQDVLGRSFESLHDKVFLLIDEAHFDPGWALALKCVFDRSDSVFTLVTGSSALALGETADTARRAITHRVLPLTFREFLRLDGDTNIPTSLSSGIAQVLFGSLDYHHLREGLLALRSEMQARIVAIGPYVLERYLRLGSMPYSLRIEDETIAMAMVHSTVDRVVQMDLPTYRPLDRTTQMKASNLLSHLAFGDRLSLQSLATNLESNKVTISQILEGLERADIVHRLYPHGPESTRLRRTPLFRFTSPAMRAALLWKLGRSNMDQADYGLMMEDASTLVLRRAQGSNHIARFDFDPRTASADFILTRGDSSRIVLEVGFGRKDNRQAKTSMQRVDGTYGLVVAKGELSFDDKERMVRIPREWFLLAS